MSDDLRTPKLEQRCERQPWEGDRKAGSMQAPSDAAADAAWDKIASLARDHALVAQAYGGVMVLVLPAVQREQAGMRDQTLRAHRMHEREGGTP